MNNFGPLCESSTAFHLQNGFPLTSGTRRRQSTSWDSRRPLSEADTACLQRILEKLGPSNPCKDGPVDPTIGSPVKPQSLDEAKSK